MSFLGKLKTLHKWKQQPHLHKSYFSRRILNNSLSSYAKPERYKITYEQSLQNPQEFWENAAHDIHWFKKWDQVLDKSNPPFYRWFTGGLMNSCYNAIDFHLQQGRAHQNAIIYDSPVTNQIQYLTFEDLHQQGVLSAQGVKKGDRVIVYMPVIPQAVIAMLACARIGAVHSTIFGGFSSKEIASRIDDAQPKMIVYASCGIEKEKVIPYKPLVDGAIRLAKCKPKSTIVFQRPQGESTLTKGLDHDWDELMNIAKPHDCVPVLATDPLYILYTSGTTGTPKGVLRDHGGHNVALKWCMTNVMNTAPGECFWAASDVGWVLGHTFMIYGPLFQGCTTVLYEGKPVDTPNAGSFWRVASMHKVNTMFTAPTALRAIRKEDPKGDEIKKHLPSHLRSMFVAGERADPATMDYFSSKINVPIIDNWWQTETGWPMTASCRGLGDHKLKFGSSSFPVPGYQLEILDDQGKSLPHSTLGNIVARLPLPPGAFPTLHNNDERFIETYLSPFPGYYSTGDAGYIDQDGFVFVVSRTDDVINIAGHRLSTGAMEQCIASHPLVAECAVVGAYDKIKSQIPVGLIVLKKEVTQSHDEIIQEIIQLVRNDIGPVASFKHATIVDSLPKTRSGKILRGTIVAIADSKSYPIPATIENPTSLEVVTKGLQKIGFANLKDVAECELETDSA